MLKWGADLEPHPPSLKLWRAGWRLARFQISDWRFQRKKIVGGEEPEVQTAVEGAVPGDADGRNSALDRGPEALVVFGGGGFFDGEKGVAKWLGEALGLSQDGSEIGGDAEKTEKLKLGKLKAEIRREQEDGKTGGGKGGLAEWQMANGKTGQWEKRQRTAAVQNLAG